MLQLEIHYRFNNMIYITINERMKEGWLQIMQICYFSLGTFGVKDQNKMRKKRKKMEVRLFSTGLII